MVLEGNKDEAEKCFELSQKYFEQGNSEKAVKFAQKAQKLYPCEKFKDFEDLLNRLSATTSSSSTSSQSQSNGSAGGNGRDGVRQRAAGGSSEATPPEKKYTSEQLDAVRSIKKCKNYYEILSVSKEATDTDLKKAYRKLALQFHPDKNKAPGAAEAFKAVGNAFAVLSDTEKRKHYDLYGPDDAAHQSRGSTRHHHEFRGSEAEMTADELFNMFFGGGYPSSRVYMRTGDRWESQGNRQARRHPNHNHDTHSEQSNLSVLVQLMPLLVILLLSLASSLLSSDPIYALSANSKYTDQRMTSRLHVAYFVKPDFTREYQGSMRRLESQVEEDYIAALRNGCYKERNHKENMLWRARSFGDAQMFRRAQDMQTPSCDSLQAVYN